MTQPLKSLAPAFSRIYEFDYIPPLIPRFGADHSTVSKSCISGSGTATMCGFSEYTDASVPPKKYKNQVLDGDLVACYRTGVCGQGGGFGNVNRAVFDGESSYDPDVSCGALSANTQRVRQYNYGGGPDLCFADNLYSTLQPLSNPFSPDGSTGNVWWSNGTTFSETKTQKRWTDGCGSPNGAPPFNYSVLGDLTATLSEEDTEADAIARAAQTPGNSCTAMIEPRGAGEFSFDFVVVSYSIDCQNLIEGRSYLVQLELSTEDYGGGNQSTSHEEIAFTSSGSSHELTGLLNCLIGQQVTLVAVTIHATD